MAEMNRSNVPPSGSPRPYTRLLNLADVRNVHIGLHVSDASYLTPRKERYRNPTRLTMATSAGHVFAAQITTGLDDAASVLLTKLEAMAA